MLKSNMVFYILILTFYMLCSLQPLRMFSDLLVIAIVIEVHVLGFLYLLAFAIILLVCAAVFYSLFDSLVSY